MEVDDVNHNLAAQSQASRAPSHVPTATSSDETSCEDELLQTFQDERSHLAHETNEQAQTACEQMQARLSIVNNKIDKLMKASAALKS
ncbi:hypothetical protein BGZ98_006804, partial [Dissophora globulifera]